MPGAHTATFEAAGFFKRENVRFRLDSLLTPARLDIELVPESSVSGRVLDEEGNPVAGVPVQITQAIRGTGTTWSIFGATTDREGRYQVDGLRPGAYLAMARPKAKVRADGRVRGNTYYPSAQTRDQATPLVLRGGTELTGCDIRLLALPVHAIRGMVYDEAGKPANAAVTLTSSEALEPPQAHAQAHDGVFEFPEVASGDWRLIAEEDRGGAKMRGDGTVLVARRDVENVAMRLAAPFSVRAQVEPAIQGHLPTVELYPLDAAPIGAAFSSTDSNGAMRLGPAYPGRYRIETFGSIDGYYLDSIMAGDRDVLGKEVTITEGMPPFRIVYKPNSAGVRGTVESCGEASVLLLPEDEDLWDFRFLHRASCDRDGHFQIGGLRPGAWYALALDRVDSTGLDDLAALRRLAAMAATVRVEAGSVATVDLKVQPWPD